VKHKWEHNCKFSSQLDCEEATSEDEFYVWRIKNPIKRWIVSFSDSEAPSCECGIYKSALIPCACICLTFPRWQLRRSCPDENKVDWPLYSPKNLHNRWDPRRHPLYCLAATGQTRVAALDSIVQSSRSDVLHTPGQQAVEVENLKFDTSDEVNAISQFSYVGKSETQRYHEAKNLFDSAVAKASKNETQYKHFMACLKVGETDMKGDTTMNSLFSYLRASLQPASKPPAVSKAQKRGIVTDKDVINLAAKKKSKAPRKCKDCLQFLKISCTDHRGSSRQCPCSINNWTHRTWSEWKAYLENTYGEKLSNGATNSLQASADAHNLKIFWEVTVGKFKASGNEDQKPPFTEENKNAIIEWYHCLLQKTDDLQTNNTLQTLSPLLE
jgi:hypothetical protein